MRRKKSKLKVTGTTTYKNITVLGGASDYLVDSRLKNTFPDGSALRVSADGHEKVWSLAMAFFTTRLFRLRPIQPMIIVSQVNVASLTPEI